MKLTKEEQSNLFDLTATKNNMNPNAPKGITATNTNTIRELEENDNLSVSSGAKYKGNVTLVPSPMAKNAPPSGFSQQNQMPPQRQFQQQQQPPQSQYTPNYGFPNQPPQQHSQQQSPPFITVPNVNQSATVGSPGNFSPYFPTGPATGNTGNNEKRSVSAPRSSPNENSNNNFYRPPKPFTHAELSGNEFILNNKNNMNGSPMRLPVPGGASQQSLEMYLNGGTQQQRPPQQQYSQSNEQFPSSSSPNVPMARPQLFPPQPSTMSSASGEMKNQRIPLPANMNYSQQQQQQQPTLHPIAVTSSLSKDTLASMGNGLQPEYAAGGPNRIPLPEAGMVPRTNSSDISTIPPPNIGNNRSKIDLIRKSFSQDYSNINNISDSAAIVLPSQNQNTQENQKQSPPQAPLETSGGETKPINADEERANKVKALAQRFNAIKATTTTSQPPPPPRAAPKVFLPPQIEKKEDSKTAEKAPYPRPWEKKNLNNNDEQKNESQPPPSRPPPPPATTHSISISNEKPFQSNSFEEPKKEEEGEVEQERPSSRTGSPSRSRGWGSLTNRADNKASVLKSNTATTNEQPAGFPFGQANLRKVVKPNNPKGEDEEDDAPVPIPKYRSRNSIIMMNADKNKTNDDHAGIDPDAMNPGIHIPALKRPNLFRPPAPAETATENDDNSGRNLKAESFLAMLKPTEEGNENFSSSSGPGKLTRPNIFS
jgi:hypothetical protein